MSENNNARKSTKKASKKMPGAKKTVKKVVKNPDTRKSQKYIRKPKNIISLSTPASTPRVDTVHLSPNHARNYQQKAMELIAQLPERYGKQIVECLRKYGPSMAEPLVGHLAHKSKNPIIKALLTGLQRAIKMM